MDERTVPFVDAERAGCPHRTVTLAPGMRADAVVVDRDLLALPAEEIGSASVDVTVAGG